MSPRLSACAAGLLLLLSSCKDREITSYRAPKDPVITPPGPVAGLANTNDLPKDHPPIGPVAAPAGGNDSMAATAVPTGSDSLAWTAPAGWTAMPQRPMRKATFAVRDASGAAADLSITSFPNDTGGLLANVNRWRGQLGLPPLPQNGLAANLEQFDAHGLHFNVVDFAGAAGGQPTRLLGAVVPYQNETWFFKLMGPDALVAAQKPAFLEFLKTVQPR
ncbi:MAG: hypothetical protein JWQ83_232 [Lacunisphaera sp.]|nr:hypothetical protein [Lacunisphaera sp.]MDB6165092.1 hypothetical protein [Lacunisphaera sp.]